MTGFLQAVKQLGGFPSIVVLIIALAIMIMAKWDSVVTFFQFIIGRAPRRARSCGDCVLILFGIREKYESEVREVDRNILKSQMNYTEQKLLDVQMWLIQSFQDDLKDLGKDRSGGERVEQLAIYREALKNALLAVKDESRRSFKENGFVDLSDSEFTSYVKSKTKTLISIAKSYMSTYYPDTGSMIVKINDRFKKLDEGKIEQVVFDVVGTARDIFNDAIRKKKQLKVEFKAEIDRMVGAVKGPISG